MRVACEASAHPSAFWTYAGTHGLDLMHGDGVAWWQIFDSDPARVWKFQLPDAAKLLEPKTTQLFGLTGLSKRPSWKSNDENKFESHKQNQTNKWWQSAGFLVRTQIRLPLLTIEFLLVRSPKGALQKWRLGWSDKLTGFPRDETLFAVVFLLSKLCSICIRLISKRIV